MEAFPVTLPGGLWRDGVRHSQATLRGLTGADEVFLIDHGGHLAPAARTTALLARCLVGLGGLAEVDAEAVRSLTVGDREALLLRLRAALLGDRLDAVIECGSCGEKLEIPLSIEDLMQPPYELWEPEYEEALGTGDRRSLVRYRLPTGGDQEAVADGATRDLAAATRRLPQRCIVSVAGREPGPEDLDEVGPLVVARWEEIDPQAEATLEFVCATCGAEVTTTLDAAGFLFEELAARSPHLFHEVDALARAYHWSEAEILALSPQRRRRYVELSAGPS